MKFMLMMNMPRGNGDYDIARWPAEDFKAHIGYMKTLNKALQSEGSFVDAQGLSVPAEARIVRAGKNGAPEVTDGPFAESKEFLAGYWMIDVETKEQAYAIAARCSAAPGPGGTPLGIPIEVRQVMSVPPTEL